MATRLKIVSAIGRSARFTVRILAWIPVVIVALVLIWGYYVYVYVMNFSGKQDNFIEMMVLRCLLRWSIIDFRYISQRVSRCLCSCIWWVMVYTYMGVTYLHVQQYNVIQPFLLTAVFLVAVAHILLALQLISYLRTIFCRHREVPAEVCVATTDIQCTPFFSLSLSLSHLSPPSLSLSLTP